MRALHSDSLLIEHPQLPHQSIVVLQQLENDV